MLVSVAPETAAAEGIAAESLLTDVITGLGPASGLHAALLRFEAAFLVAVDMPYAEPRLAKQLINAAAAPQTPAEAYSAIHAGAYAPVAVAATANGRTEPTFSLYFREMLPELLSAIECGDYSLNRLLARVQTRYVEVSAETLLNVNYPDDYDALIKGTK